MNSVRQILLALLGLVVSVAPAASAAAPEGPPAARPDARKPKPAPAPAGHKGKKPAPKHSRAIFAPVLRDPEGTPARSSLRIPQANDDTAGRAWPVPPRECGCAAFPATLRSPPPAPLWAALWPIPPPAPSAAFPR